MADKMSHQGSNSVSCRSTSPSSPSKGTHRFSNTSSVQIIERVAFVEAVAPRLGGQRPRPSPRRFSEPTSAKIPILSPKKEGDGASRLKTPRRPTLGFLSPKKAIGKRLLPSSSGARAIPPDSPVYSPEYTPGMINPSRRPGPGIGKGLFSPFAMGAKAVVRRRQSPPPIRGSPGAMEWSEEEEEDDVDELRRKLAMLQLKVNNMDERVAETVIDQKEAEDKMEILHKAVTSKVKHLAKETGNEHLYRPKASVGTP